MKSATLLLELIEMTRENLSRSEKFIELSEEKLNFKVNADKWSILECLEHLNRYGDYYLPEIKKSIQAAQKPNDNEFKSGWLGNYFAKSMLPKEQLNKMQTFKSMNPIGSQLDQSVLHEFITQQKTLLELLEQAKGVHLTKNKTGVSISKWIKIRLGDTFRVVVYHNLRHIIQAEKAMEAALTDVT